MKSLALIGICFISNAFGSSIFNPDPDNSIPTCELVRNKGYPCQQFNVTTKDGYILTVHRIPNGVKSPGNSTSIGKPVVYLQHGLLDSSATWVLNFPHQSLGFMLADAGYDVWMGNVRGNNYGRAHLSISPSSRAFWHFTFDEMAKFDVPAITDYILTKTSKNNLYYVGHSQGSLTGFIGFSIEPEWAKSTIKQFHAFAPIAWMGNSTSNLKYIAPYVNSLAYILDLMGQTELLPNNAATKLLMGNLCYDMTDFICESMMTLLSGYDYQNMNGTRNTVYMTHNPAGTSAFNIAHFSQLYRTKKFQAMDWGAVENLIGFGGSNPVEYQPNKITVPTALYWGTNDVLANPPDVAQLQSQIKNLLGSYEYKDMDHIDFVWGLNAAAGPYQKLIETIGADVAASATQ